MPSCFTFSHESGSGGSSAAVPELPKGPDGQAAWHGRETCERKLGQGSRPATRKSDSLDHGTTSVVRLAFRGVSGSGRAVLMDAEPSLPGQEHHPARRVAPVPFCSRCGGLKVGVPTACSRGRGGARRCSSGGSPGDAASSHGPSAELRGYPASCPAIMSPSRFQTLP